VKLQKEVCFIFSILDDSIIEDNIDPLEVQEALDRAVTSQKLAGLYRDRPTFMLSSRVITIGERNE
jgi:hypothetical protein